MPDFRLIPFAAAPLTSALALTGTVERAGARIDAEYRLAGDLSGVVIPESAVSTRRDGLWQTTCFELFVAPREQTRYLEINLSPCGDWNAYSFTAYREGMAPLPIARFTSRRSESGAAEFVLGFELELASKSAADSVCDIAVTAVLEHLSGEKSYWALVHPTPRPDFHNRNGFTLRASS